MIAVKIAVDGGSAVMVLGIDEGNVLLVVFSNVSMENSNNTNNGEVVRDRDQFERWFDTLLN